MTQMRQSGPDLHCDLDPRLDAGIPGCSCEACRLVGAGIKDDFDVNDFDAVLRRQRSDLSTLNSQLSTSS
jgi:hypothetical protein